MVVQRIYETNMDYETVKEEVLLNKTDFQYKGDMDHMKLLCFRLREFPKNLIQLTPRKQFLMLHGMKPFDYFQDLRIMRALALSLKTVYPSGIQFRLYREKIPSRDKNEMIEIEHMISRFHRSEIRVLQVGGEERHQKFLSKMWEITANNERYRAEFVDVMNNVMAQWLLIDGLISKQDGSVVPLSPGRVIPLAQDLTLESLENLENDWAKVLSKQLNSHSTPG